MPVECWCFECFLLSWPRVYIALARETVENISGYKMCEIYLRDKRREKNAPWARTCINVPRQPPAERVRAFKLETHTMAFNSRISDRTWENRTGSWGRTEKCEWAKGRKKENADTLLEGILFYFLILYTERTTSIDFSMKEFNSSNKLL